MGIYDRDYERERPYDYDSPGFHVGGGSMSWTIRLLIVMGVVYLVQLFTAPPRGMRGEGWFTELFSLHSDMPLRPWYFFQLLTYGFLHDVHDLKHILFNGFTFWMFGRDIERRYGAKEFVAFYLVAIVVAGLAWLGSEFVASGGFINATMLGASGGVCAVLILYCVNFPQRQLILFPLPIPIRAWVVGVVFFIMELFGVSGARESNVAYTAHIGGAIFALVYFWGGVRLSRFVPSGFKLPKLNTGPSLRVHTPTDADDAGDEASEAAVDDVLRKIREHGQDSLTRQERRILEQASKEYQKRRK